MASKGFSKILYKCRNERLLNIRLNFMFFSGELGNASEKSACIYLCFVELLFSAELRKVLKTFDATFSTNPSRCAAVCFFHSLFLACVRREPKWKMNYGLVVSFLPCFRICNHAHEPCSKKMNYGLLYSLLPPSRTYYFLVQIVVSCIAHMEDASVLYM